MYNEYLDYSINFDAERIASISDYTIQEARSLVLQAYMFNKGCTIDEAGEMVYQQIQRLNQARV